MLALASADNRSENLKLGLRRQRHDGIHHLVNRLLFDLLATLGAMGDTDSGIEQTQIIVNLGDCSYGGTGVTVRGLLVNGNRRG